MPEHAAGFSTRAIHVGQAPDPLTGAVIPPIHLSTTFAQNGVGNMPAGYDYSRSGNPTRTALQQCLAALEAVGTDGSVLPNVQGLAFSSGLAAGDVLLRATLRPGDHVVIPNDAYGGTFRLIDKVLTRAHVTYSVVALGDMDGLAEAAAKPNTKLVWAETPSNPLLTVADIRAYAEVAHAAGALLVVDNTFATPYLQNPLAWGADVVLHSTTKYLGGHSDVVGGALITNNPELAADLEFLQNAAGAVPSPFDCWLTLRGLKTLAVRMDRHNASAASIAAMLSDREDVLSVLYPGLKAHLGHEVAARQMRGFGGMVSFRVAGGAQRARKVCEATRYFTLAESLGGVESLIEVPAAMTHASAADSELAVPADLIRLSVGIEDASDLLADLKQALDSVAVAPKH